MHTLVRKIFRFYHRRNDYNIQISRLLRRKASTSFKCSWLGYIVTHIYPFSFLYVQLHEAIKDWRSIKSEELLNIKMEYEKIILILFRKKIQSIWKLMLSICWSENNREVIIFYTQATFVLRPNIASNWHLAFYANQTKQFFEML